tara:strand:+ start:327 stop:557 length:231 start_codon:yes stop_codon:yes gene_type:complete
MLKQLFKETKKRETHIYMSNINKVVDETKDRIRKLKAEHAIEGNDDIVHGLHLALIEMSFMTSEIMLEQLKKDSNV